MLQKLHENDRQTALAFLRSELAYNVFTIGDIENFGFDTDFQNVWADIDSRGNFRVLILRYYRNFIVYAHDGFTDFANTLSFLSENTDAWMLSGKKSIVYYISEKLGIPSENIQNHNLAQLESELFTVKYTDDITVEWATDENFHEVIQLQSGIEEFQRLGGSTDAIVFNQKSKTGRTAMVRHNGIVVASASSAAENSESAMIIGVCTMDGYRNRGYASACLQTLCADLLNKKKTVCLFYNNPLAARIYRKMGSRDIGCWAFVNVKRIRD